MKKAEFIGELERRLSRLPEYEQKKTTSYYEEMIEDRVEDGMTEEEAVLSLGPLDAIVSEITMDTPLAALVQSKIKDSREKSQNQTLWTVLALCGFPLWLPLMIAGAAIVFALYICIWAVAISLFAALFSLGLGGAIGVIGGIVILTTNNIPAALALLGMGLVLCGLFLILLKPLLWLAKQILTLTGVLLRKVKSLFRAKKEEQK